jgi:hypothetical protein
MCDDCVAVQYVIEEIEKEEKIAEALKNRAVKLDKFAVKGEIQCCKMLNRLTDLNKPKCKVWLARAKEACLLISPNVM